MHCVRLRPTETSFGTLFALILLGTGCGLESEPERASCTVGNTALFQLHGTPASELPERSAQFAESVAADSPQFYSPDSGANMLQVVFAGSEVETRAVFSPNAGEDSIDLSDDIPIDWRVALRLPDAESAPNLLEAFSLAFETEPLRASACRSDGAALLTQAGWDPTEGALDIDAPAGTGIAATSPGAGWSPTDPALPVVAPRTAGARTYGPDESASLHGGSTRVVRPQPAPQAAPPIMPLPPLDPNAGQPPAPAPPVGSPVVRDRSYQLVLHAIQTTNQTIDAAKLGANVRYENEWLADSLPAKAAGPLVEFKGQAALFVDLLPLRLRTGKQTVLAVKHGANSLTLCDLTVNAADIQESMVRAMRDRGAMVSFTCQASGYSVFVSIHDL
jgi:hypothetical protein